MKVQIILIHICIRICMRVTLLKHIVYVSSTSIVIIILTVQYFIKRSFS